MLLHTEFMYSVLATLRTPMLTFPLVSRNLLYDGCF